MYPFSWIYGEKSANSGVGRRQPFQPPKLPHLFLLVGENPQGRSRLASAEEYEAGLAIFRKVADRVGLIDLAALQKTACAGQAPALVAECGKQNSVCKRGIPDVLFGAHLDDAGLLIWLNELNFEDAGRRTHGIAHGGAAWPLHGQAGTMGSDFTGCRSPRSCCRARDPDRRGGSVRKESTCRRAPWPAAR